MWYNEIIDMGLIRMIEFFRDVLDGPLYIVVAILSVIFIVAIIGFIMERKKFEKEEKSKIAVISPTNVVVPIEPVPTIEGDVTVVTNQIDNTTVNNNDNINVNTVSKFVNSDGSELQLEIPIINSDSVDGTQLDDNVSHEE